MIIPATRYRDCEAALKFLKEVFGLSEHAVYRGEDTRIVHAQMVHGGGMMMFGPAQRGDFDAFMIDPAETGGRETTTIYVVTREIEALYARVRESGARILLPLKAEDHGGKSFSAADSEGHVWTFGDYDPMEPDG